jgi:hypothetical protein
LYTSPQSPQSPPGFADHNRESYFRISIQTMTFFWGNIATINANVLRAWYAGVIHFLDFFLLTYPEVGECIHV